MNSVLHLGRSVWKQENWSFVSLAYLLKRLCHLRRYGQGLVEYALILVLIAFVVIGSLTVLGQQTNTLFARVSCTMEGGTFHQDNGNGNSSKCK